jgi:hypothetical protein
VVYGKVRKVQKGTEWKIRGKMWDGRYWEIHRKYRQIRERYKGIRNGRYREMQNRRYREIILGYKKI